MPTGNLDTYFIVGRHPEAEGASLEEALVEMFTFVWTKANLPTLGMHIPGNLRIELFAGSTSIEFEITDPALLKAAMNSPQAILDYVAKQMNMGEKAAISMLEETSARVKVDCIYWSDQAKTTHWAPDAGMSSAEVLPDGTPVLLKHLVGEEDQGRARGRRRTPRGRHLLQLAVDLGRARGWKDRKISQQTGIPVSTVRDARVRVEREELVQKTFPGRQRGQRLTKDQKDLIISELAKSKDNAAAVARKLGLSSRTIRDVRARSIRPSAPRVLTAKASAATKSQLVELVKAERITPTEAGRRLGVPGRTARQWIQKAREDLSK